MYFLYNNKVQKTHMIKLDLQYNYVKLQVLGTILQNAAAVGSSQAKSISIFRGVEVMGGNLQSAMRLQPMRLKNVQIIVGGQYIGRQFYFYFKVETIESTVSKKLSDGGGGGHK